MIPCLPDRLAVRKLFISFASEPRSIFKMLLLPLQTVLSALTKVELLGTKFVPSDFVPSVFLQIKFPNDQEVQLGNLLGPEAVGGRNGDEPTIGFLIDEPTSIKSGSSSSSTSNLYTIISVDPDAPSRKDQSMGPWRHWIRHDIKPYSLDGIIEEKEKLKAEGSTEDKKLDLWIADEKRKGTVLTQWAGPSPGAGSGPHRYLFLLYLQNGTVKPLSEQSTIKSNERIDRRNFDIETFVVENDLELVGANFFMCENPDTI